MKRAVLRSFSVLAWTGAALLGACAAGPDHPAPSDTEEALERGGVQAGAVRGDAQTAVCGDGVRQATEECDEGAAATDKTFCTQLCRVRDLLAVAPPSGDAGPALPRRTLGAGAHPIAAMSGSVGAVYIGSDAAGTSVGFEARDPNGLSLGAPVALDPAAPFDANPVVGASAGGAYAVVWSDFGGDGDGRGIALRTVSPSGGAGPLVHVNTTTVGDQRDPDLLVATGGSVVAFTDYSNPSTAPDVRYVILDGALRPIGPDQPLAATADSEGEVVLATIGHGWAAAWRAGSGGTETLRIAAGATQWSVGPYAAGPADDRPALVALDTAHLLVVYGEAAAPAATDGGAASGAFRLKVAVLDAGAPGTVASVVLSPSALAQSQPVTVQAGGHTYVAWHEDGAPDDPKGEEVYLKEIVWNGTAIDLSQAPIPLPRWSTEQVGDQRRPALAAAQGPALFAAWTDLGRAFGTSEALGDLALELAPVPLLRLPGGTPNPPACTTGRYCNFACTDPQTDPNNCGNCGMVCPSMPNGHGTCVAGQCGAACNTGFLSCGGLCVAPNDPTHCGSCTNVCTAPANAVPTCTAPPTCGFTCNAPYSACGAQCVNESSDPANCGSCGHTCTAPSNGSVACTGGQCVASCNAGLAVCQGSCVDPNDPKTNPCLVDEAHGVFASSSLGSATGDGSRAKPYASLQAAINAAKAQNKRVYACAETFNEAVTLADGVAMYGFLNCASGWALGTGVATVQSPTSPAVTAQTIHTTTKVQSFAFVAPDGAANASIGLVARDAAGLWLVDSRVHGGNGANGANGAAGVPLVQVGAVNGSALTGGVSVCNYANGTYAGAALSGGAGGAGGRAGVSSWVCTREGPGGALTCTSVDTAPGPGANGSGGALGQAVDGAAAQAGASGVIGAMGTSGGSMGTLSRTALYAPTNGGTAGTNGTPGAGGGGAAGTWAATEATALVRKVYGTAGNGGGGGGCAGVVATPGAGGAASIAVVAIDSPMRIERTTLESSRGGDGGSGAFGSLGGAPGAGGGAGGGGGSGGSAGHGGGGPSFVLAVSGAAPVLVGATTVLGSGGKGRPLVVKVAARIPASADGVAQVQVGF